VGLDRPVGEKAALNGSLHGSPEPRPPAPGLWQWCAHISNRANLAHVERVLADFQLRPGAQRGRPGPQRRPIRSVRVTWEYLISSGLSDSYPSPLPSFVALLPCLPAPAARQSGAPCSEQPPRELDLCQKQPVIAAPTRTHSLPHSPLTKEINKDITI
jgi:hypothetical protein